MVYGLVNNVRRMDKFVGKMSNSDELVTDSVAAAVDLIARPKLLLAVLEMRRNPVTPLTLTNVYGIARSTSGFYLRQLEASGLVKKVVGVDRRRSYYVLTDLGNEVIDKAKELLTNALVDKCGTSRTSEGATVLGRDCLKKFLVAYGKHGDRIMKWLGIQEKLMGYSHEYVIEVREE